MANAGRGRFWLCALGGVAGLIASYALAALVLGLMPVNRSFVEPADGVEIFVFTNGVHAGLALPLSSPEVDLAGLFPPPPGNEGREIFVMIGWGDRRVYTETPTWADVSLPSVVLALLGSNDTVVHVEHIARPRGSADFVAVRLGAEGYRRLVAHMRASLRGNGAGRPVFLPGVNHGRRDAFYLGTGRYTAIYTCNEWVRAGLAAAGVRTAVWAPLDWAIFHHLRR